MALRNSLKATLLDEEQPSSRSDAPGPLVAASAPVAQRPSPSTAKPDPIAAAWHGRAEELRVMVDTLPSEASQILLWKIADIYDALARDAGWSEHEDARAPDGLPPEEEPPAETAPPAVAPSAAPPALERTAFPRRSLPLARPVPRRRA